MLPLALLSLISTVLAVPTHSAAPAGRKPDCPSHAMLSQQGAIGEINSPVAAFRKHAVATETNLAQNIAEQIRPFLDAVPGCDVTIPVQFNNFHIEGSTARVDGYVTDAQFAQALARLNADYAELTSMKFSLRRINRIPVSAAEWDALEITSSDAAQHLALGQQVKGTSVGQDELQVLHVHLVKDADACGFTYIPVSDWSQEAILRDAVVLDTKCFDGSSSFRSSTFTHEVGHWSGLYHTFEGGCTGSGDFIADTPPAMVSESREERLYGDCENPASQTSCGSTVAEDIRVSLANYMSYSLDDCRTEFTTGQVERMYSVLAMARGYSSSC